MDTQPASQTQHPASDVRSVRPLTPSASGVPEWQVRYSQIGDLDLTVGEALLLMRVDGERSVDDLVALAGLEPLVVHDALRSLVSLGIVRVRGEAPPVAIPRAPNLPRDLCATMPVKASTGR